MKPKLDLRRAIPVMLACIVMSASAAAALPQNDDQLHNGVGSCGGSMCHGSPVQRGSNNVLQNEFATWTEADPLSRAYAVLKNQQSRDIARKLGLPNAHEADICLDCHADNVGAERRGENFVLDDGIGCEACHGGSGNWLASHDDPGVTHEDNVANGMYPTHDAASRAALCLSCHYGTADKFATHQIMAAGHPRLSFELTTLTNDWRYPQRDGLQLDNEHFVIDADYESRKDVLPETGLWVAGALQMGATTAETLAGDRVTGGGLVPELALFDCHACHRSMKLESLRWQERSATKGIGPGVLRLNDSALLVAAAVAGRLDGSNGARIATRVRDLHVAATRSRDEIAQVASDLGDDLERAMRQADQKGGASRDASAYLDLMLDLGASGEFQDYAAAEQAWMGIYTLIYESGRENRYNRDLPGAFALLEDDEAYDPDAFRQLMIRMQGE
jgi:hypothetical protein